MITMDHTQEAPKDSPWGPVQDADFVSEGMWWVGTGSHGGLMIKAQLGDRLSQEAKDKGAGFGREPSCPWSTEWFVFEEDSDWMIAYAELKEVRVFVQAGYQNTYPEEVAAVTSEIQNTVLKFAAINTAALNDGDVFGDIDEIVSSSLTALILWDEHQPTLIAKTWRRISTDSPWMESIMEPILVDFFETVDGYPSTEVAGALRALLISV